MHWAQNYDPFGNAFLSTVVAALPVLILLGCLASGRVKAHVAALLAAAAAAIIALLALRMPAPVVASALLTGAAYGLLPIGWIVVNVIFVYQLTKQEGAFDRLQQNIAGITTDRRLQLVLIAFSLGAFFEGAAGFGTPVAITAALLIGLGFTPLQASGLSLIANTAPVAFGAMGTPIIALAGVTGIDLLSLSKMVGRQVPFFAVLIPFWLVYAFAGIKAVGDTWPALLVAGASFAIPQFLISNYHGPWLADVVAATCSLVVTTWFIRARHARAARLDRSLDDGVHNLDIRAWSPWIILCATVFVWGLSPVKAALNRIFAPQIHVPYLDGIVQRMPPLVAKISAEPAVYSFNILSATGTSILLAGILAAIVLRVPPKSALKLYASTLRLTAPSLLTIVAMMSLGYLTRYSGMDGILGLAFARTGVLYPIFGTFLGWMGVALTGSDTSSNVLFGSLQKVTSEHLGLSPTLMAAANSSGGVMGKMIDAQSIVVASTATKWYGNEGRILRFVMLHSLILVSLMALLVYLQAYVFPFKAMVP